MIGVDIIKISKVEKIINNFGQKFIKRFFHKEEIDNAEKFSFKKKVCYFAKRFAVKEAFLKAKGHGIGLRFADICTTNDKYGKPIIFYRDQALKNVQVSLSDDGDYAVAFVTIEKC